MHNFQHDNLLFTPPPTIAFEIHNMIPTPKPNFCSRALVHASYAKIMSLIAQPCENI